MLRNTAKNTETVWGLEILQVVSVSLKDILSSALTQTSEAIHEETPLDFIMKSVTSA